MSSEKLTAARDLSRNMAQTQTKEKAVVPAPQGKSAD
jgi:hypothetical protein